MFPSRRWRSLGTIGNPSLELPEGLHCDSPLPNWLRAPVSASDHVQSRGKYTIVVPDNDSTRAVEYQYQCCPYTNSTPRMTGPSGSFHPRSYSKNASFRGMIPWSSAAVPPTVNAPQLEEIPLML